MSFNIEVQGGSTVRLPTKGKYCDRDIVITGLGGGGITPDTIATASIEGDIEINATSVSSYAFHSNENITSIKMPNVSNVNNYAFYGCTGLTSIFLPLCTTLGKYCFYNTSLTELNLPECTDIPNNAFDSMDALLSVNLPKVATIGSGCFRSSKLTELILPECISIGNSAFGTNKKLEYIDLPKCTSIVNYAFRGSTALVTLILRSETMCTLAAQALNNTAIWSGNGHVYIPQSLIESYQVATNWATIYATNSEAFQALEDWTVDGTITGALNEEQYVVLSSPNSFTLSVVNNTKYWDGTIEYSIDAQNWFTWDGTSVISADDGILYMRGTGNTYITGGSGSSSKGAWRPKGSNITICGNIETLLDYATVASGEHPTMANSAFRALFAHNASDLGTSITDISHLHLPADTLTAYCYRAMFQYCAIPATPKLPATTLAASCYRDMFYGCTSCNYSGKRVLCIYVQ